jgi:hypothetical protein
MTRTRPTWCAAISAPPPCGCCRSQAWQDDDEEICRRLKARLVAGRNTIPVSVRESAYATHVVAAAVSAAALGEATPAVLFDAMLGMLKRMHDENPSWGPLFVGHRGDAGRHLVAVRPRAATAVADSPP